MRCWLYWLASFGRAAHSRTTSVAATEGARSFRSVIITVALGTNCYNCGSLGPQVASCFMLYIKPSQVAINCQDSSTALVQPGCIKITYSDGDGDTVWRGCADYSSVTASGGVNSCAEGVYSGRPVRYCHCSADLCNGARPSVGSERATHLLAVSAFAVLLANLH